MKMNTFRFIKGFGAILKVSGVIALPSVCLAADGAVIPWEQQPEVLRSEIEGYVNSSHDPAMFKVQVAEDVRVVYLGFSPEEIEQNAEQFPDIPGHEVTHLPYGREDYYSIPVNIVDYQTNNTITLLSVDLTKDVVPGADLYKGDIRKVLDPDGDFFHAIGTSVYQLMGAGGVIVELGPPIERFRDAEFFYRKALLNTACTSQFDYASFDDGTQENTMVVYSGAEPGSAEQLQCLEMQALVFMRPAGLAFESVSSND